MTSASAKLSRFRRLLIPATVALALAEPPVLRPEFEVASIRRNIEGGPFVFNGMKSLGTFSAENQTLKNLIQEAYGVPSGRRNWLPFLVAAGQGVSILEGPAWVASDRYDITAKWNAVPADGKITIQSMGKAESEMDSMLRSLLEQRFKLKVHRETRQLPVYEMTVAAPGKLRQGSCTTFDPGDPRQSSAADRQAIPYCGASSEGRKGADWTLDGTGMKMGELASTLSWLIGNRTVVDKTGYTGTFDAHLRWTPGPGELGAINVAASPDDATGSVFTVLQEQLGLRLKAAKGPVEVLVIDNAERPTAN